MFDDYKVVAKDVCSNGGVEKHLEELKVSKSKTLILIL
jgi:hypothetical protein